MYINPNFHCRTGFVTRFTNLPKYNIYISKVQSLGGGRTHFVPLIKVMLRKGFASSSDNIFAYLTRPVELEPGPIHLYSP